MKVDSLDELESAFARWRKGKKHVREPMPEPLRARARRAMQKHGVKAVARVTRVERTRLVRTAPAHVRSKGAPKSAVAYSRLELSAPPPARPLPIAEVETEAGVTLRVFEPTSEMMGLLSAACGLAGIR
jgi:hypothetical protein